MAVSGWRALIEEWPWYRGGGKYPIVAYSEFMPPPRLGRKPYGNWDTFTFREADPYGWYISEYERRLELDPGCARIADQLLGSFASLAAGRSSHGISKGKLQDNPYWPDALAKRAGQLTHEHLVMLLPLALSRTQDDKGRVRWTLFGGSEQGPGRAFWRGFFSAPDTEMPEARSLRFFRSLLHRVYGQNETGLDDLRAVGLRILPAGEDADFPYWREVPLPRWTANLLFDESEPIERVRYLLTFRAFATLPQQVQQAYLAGSLHLLPFPGSLVFWGTRPYRQLSRKLAFAMQIPLLQAISRHENWHGIRVPQSGWLHDPRGARDEHVGPYRDTFKRTHRWERVLRHDDETAGVSREDHMHRVLFSAHPDDIGLYGKPMARNAQLWSRSHACLLDGPNATGEALRHALATLQAGGTVGYRFYYPPMQVGRRAVFWQRPLLAFRDPASGRAELLQHGPQGYLTAYDADRPDLANPIELWPRLLDREPQRLSLEIFEHGRTHIPYQDAINVRKLLESRRLRGDAPLPPTFARALLTTAKRRDVSDWLEFATAHLADAEARRRLTELVRSTLANDVEPALEPVTYARTATRPFEVRFWKTIATLAEGRYLTKNNGDCIRDALTQKQLAHHVRDLDALGDYLLAYYRKAVAAADMTERALVGDQPFRWQTDFDFSWMGGWLNNQQEQASERNLVVVIPGNNRDEAVIMADHYDTAYMEDTYGTAADVHGARIAASGADDNHSATSCLMLAAPILLKLSREGRLARDVWLIHLTGEEFPADCLGARHLCERLVEGNFGIRMADGKSADLSNTRVCGVYVLDMIAHNNERERDVFQMAPGSGPEALWLAYQAHLATELWNAGTVAWNRRPMRRGLGRGQRSAHGSKVPEIAQHVKLRGEVRPHYGPRSTLFNTDGQIFSDAGVPVVLFMENYDINRKGYHDTHDTMENIDLDYGAAVAAVAIEAVVRAATEPLPSNWGQNDSSVEVALAD
jgi:hypothetical protein